MGTFTVHYDGTAQTVTVTYNISLGFYLTEAHVFVGSGLFPLNNGNITVAPGQYTVVDDPVPAGSENTYVAIIDVAYLGGGDIYAIAHGVVCGAYPADR